LLYEGRQIYFGPKDDAKEFFTNLGFLCPDRQTTADFLTSLTNPAERIVRPGFETRAPRTPDEFEQAWRNSKEREQLMNDIAAFEEEYPLGGPSFDKFHQSRKAEKSPLVSEP